MNAYITDNQAATALAALGLPSDIPSAQAIIDDAEVLWNEIDGNPWITDDQIATWAQATWSATDGTRLAAARTLLEAVGKVIALPANWTTPAPPPVP